MAKGPPAHCPIDLISSVETAQCPEMGTPATTIQADCSAEVHCRGRWGMRIDGGRDLSTLVSPATGNHPQQQQGWALLGPLGCDTIMATPEASMGGKR